MSHSKRRERLFRLSLEALQAEAERPANGLPPVTGDTLVFPDAEPGLEWLLVAWDARGRALLVPLDAMPLVGGRDLSLEEQIGEPLTVRCSFPVWLPDDLLAAGLKARHVEKEVVERTRAKLEDVESNTLTPTLFEQEAEADSEYCAWADRLRASSLRLQTRIRQPEQEAPAIAPFSQANTRSWSRRRFSPVYALAALLVAVFGLSLQVYRLTQHLRVTTGPILIPSRDAGELRLGSEDRGLETRLLAAGKTHSLLYLVFRDVPDYSSYAVRLLDSEGAVWWQSRAFPRGEQILILPVLAKPARLQLLGLSADGTASILDDRRLIPEGPAAVAP